jgi:hypothetical protein
MVQKAELEKKVREVVSKHTDYAAVAVIVKKFLKTDTRNFVELSVLLDLNNEKLFDLREDVRPIEGCTVC